MPASPENREGLAFIGDRRKLGGGTNRTSQRLSVMVSHCGSSLVWWLVGKEKFFFPPAGVCEVSFFLLGKVRCTF